MRAGSAVPESTETPGGAWASARRRLRLSLGVWALLAAGCSESDMVVQPKYKPLQPSTFFADGQSSRPIEPGTVAVGQLNRSENTPYATGHKDGKLVSYIPVRGFEPDSNLDRVQGREARLAILKRGEQRFNVFCSPCHGRTGEGNGMIVQRGFSPPPSFHLPRLREAPPGHFYHAITNGFGAMYSYASRIEPADRWAIVAYVRALQLSQNARAADAPKGGDRPGAEGSPAQ